MDRSEEWLKQIGKLVLPTQMIAAGLISGLLAFAVIAVAMRGGALLAAPGLMAKLAAGYAIASVGASMLIAPLIERAARRKIPIDEAASSEEWMAATAELAQAFQIETIVTYAVYEGAGFFNLIVVILEGGLLPLSVAGIILLLMVARFPTRLKFVSWLERQVRTAKDECA